jgi:hypothetical protein
MMTDAWLLFKGVFGESQYADFMIYTFGTFILHEFFWLAFNLPYLYIDDKKLFQNYKIQSVISFAQTSLTHSG